MDVRIGAGGETMCKNTLEKQTCTHLSTTEQTGYRNAQKEPKYRRTTRGLKEEHRDTFRQWVKGNATSFVTE